MQIRWTILLILLIWMPALVAQQAIFIKGREVEGIPVSSFYLSAPISNQDYFILFKRGDIVSNPYGHKKLYLILIF